MPKIITEDMIEQAAIKALQERHDYIVLNCMTEEPDTLPDGTGRKDKKQVVLPDVMFESLCRINPDIPEQTVRTVVDELCRTPVSGDLMLTNYQNYQKIRNGITVEYNKNGKKTSNILRLLSYNDALSNTFTVASQMWIKGETHWRRPDLIIFINGFPMVFIELKNSNIPVKNAYDINLKNYLKDIPYLFNYNQICVLSNGTETRLGSFAAGYEFFFEWLKVANEKENPDRKAIRENCTSLEYFIAGLCEPNKLLDYIENFILYDRRRTKIIAKNHQFFGVNNAYNAFLRREELKGKLGVFWHTQGSGKSYSMVMLARKIKHKCTGNFTFLIVTDREDLDTQIYKNFLRTEFITDKDKVQPANSKQLREELKTNKSILFTLIHKFRYDKGKKYPVLSERDDIIVIVDEAHRTQYKDLAENMRTGLPNAQFLAFTGTPLLGAKRLTNAWFGDYVSEYNFAESIKDNATVPLYYVKRVPEVELQNDFLDSDFAEILEEENLTDAEQRRLENHYAKELEVIKRDDRLDAIAQHIVYQLLRRVEPVFAAFQYGKPGVVPPGIRFHRLAGDHLVGTSAENTGGAVPAEHRMLPHPAQIFPGQGLTKRGGDFTLLLQLFLRHAGPAHHAENQVFHLQHGRDQQGAGRCRERQAGKVGANAGRPERNRFPARLGKIQRGLNVRHGRPGGQLLAAAAALAVAGKVDGQHLSAPGADQLCEGFCFFLAAHLSVQKQITLLGGFPVQDSGDRTD